MPGSIDKSKQDKIFVEKYDDLKEPLTIELSEADGLRTGIFVGNCKGTKDMAFTLIIKGKCKNITLSNCENAAIVFDNCVTTTEIIGSKKIQCQAVEICGSYVVDKSDRVTLFLADGSLKEGGKVVLYTCQSTGTNVVQSDATGEDQVEHGMPDQILSTFTKGTAPQHEIVLPEAAVPKDQR